MPHRPSACFYAPNLCLPGFPISQWRCEDGLLLLMDAQRGGYCTSTAWNKTDGCTTADVPIFAVYCCNVHCVLAIPALYFCPVGSYPPLPVQNLAETTNLQFVTAARSTV